MRELKENAVRGGFAKVCAQAVNFLVRLGSLMMFARLLQPEDFGLVGMVTVFTGVISLFKDFGLSTVTVQRVTITEEETSTLFWLNLLVGAILGFLTLAIAPILVAFYHEPRLFWVTIALATGFVFNAAGVQHTALLQRQMRFTTLAVIEIVSVLASAAIGIGMAIGGLEYWALVGWSIALPAASCIGAWLVMAWIPAGPRRGVAVRSMIRFGGTVTLNSLIAYIAFNLDKVLLGRFWGADALGIYGRAYQLIIMPTENLNSAIGGVAFSTLSRLQDDHSRLKSYFLKGYPLVLAMTLPITIMCALFPDDIILVLLGPKWENAAVILRFLTPAVLVFALITPVGWLLLSIGMVGRSLKVALVVAPLVTAGYVIGLPYGPKGVAFGYSAMMILWGGPLIVWCLKGTMISLRDLLQSASRPLLSGIMAGGVAYAVQFFLGHLLSPFLRLVLGAGVLLGAYLWILLWAMGQKLFYLDLFQALRGYPSVEGGK
jgi:PST family polysaccharide transporter